MSRLDRSLIAGLSSFQGLHPGELDSMIGQARSLRIARDQAVFEQEQDAHAFFLLLDGHVRVIKTTPGGEEVIVRYNYSGRTDGHCKRSWPYHLSSQRHRCRRLCGASLAE